VVTKLRKIIASLEKQHRELGKILKVLHEVNQLPIAKVRRAVLLEDHERAVISGALRRSKGNQSEAARMLGIGRDRLRYKVAKYKLGRELRRVIWHYQK
jgi:DNA-binding NtrC family response regulator